MHHGEIYRLRRWFANSSSGEQAPRPPSCECEVDSMSKLIEPRRMGLHNYDAHLCIIIMERYRSGHNGADSKSVCANAHEGSNPSLSAKKKNHPIGWFFLFLNGGERGVRTQWTKQPSELFCERWPKIFARHNKRQNPKCWAKIKNESLLSSGSAKNSRVGEYPSLL